MMVRVLVSDLGKVLLPFDTERVWSALEPHWGIPHPEARRAVQSLFGETRYGAGGVDGRTFHRLLTERTGLRLSFDAFAHAWSDMFWVDETVTRLVHGAPVAARYLLSNTNDLHWEFIQRHFDPVLRGFDRLFASHLLGLEKPDPAIYRHVVEAGGYAPGEYLLIDDVAENVEGARAVGMDAILHTDAHSLWRELNRRGLAGPQDEPIATAGVVATPAHGALWDPHPQAQSEREN